MDWEICSGPLLRWARRSELELERAAWCRFLDAVELYACDAEGNALLSSPPRAIDDLEERGGGGASTAVAVCVYYCHTQKRAQGELATDVVAPLPDRVWPCNIGFSDSSILHRCTGCWHRVVEHAASCQLPAAT